MSNYINVLRRLERDRRAPEPAAAPLSAPVPVSAPIPARTKTVPTERPAPAPSPEPIAAPTPNVEIVATNPPPRTVVPLPSAIATSPLPPPAVSVPAPSTVALPTAFRPVEPHAPTRYPRTFAAEAHPGIAKLLDGIRHTSSVRGTRTVVFCGASNAEAVGVLASALATHAQRSGMSAFLAMLNRTAAGTAVMPSHGSATDALAIDLDDHAFPDGLTSWIQRVAPSSDLVIITGPPLATSLDAALFARACDGLVIVAESEVTERAALQLAAERARMAGCNTLGVVMHGTKDRVPGWLRRLVGDRMETPAPRED